MGAICYLDSYFVVFFKSLDFKLCGSLIFFFCFVLFCYYSYVFWLLFLCGVKFDLYKGRGSMRLDVFFFLFFSLVV